MGTRARAPGTGVPPAHALRVNTSLLGFPFLHPLKNWSLLETRGGSNRPQPIPLIPNFSIHLANRARLGSIWHGETLL